MIEAEDCYEMLVQVHRPAQNNIPETALNSNRQLAYRLADVSALIWGLIRTSEAKYLSGRNVNKNENKVYL
jgi:hypothetical protein